jgi:integrase
VVKDILRKKEARKSPLPLTYEELRDYYFRSAKLARCKPITIQKYMGYAHKMLPPYMKGFNIQTLTPIEAEDIIRQIGREHSRSAALQSLSLLKGMFNFGIDFELVVRNPFRPVYVPPPPPRETLWEPEHREKFLEYAELVGQYDVALFVTLAYETSQRANDILRLKLRDVQDNVVMFVQGKTKRRLKIPISHEAIFRLQAHVANRKYLSQEDYIFRSLSNRSSHLKYRTLFTKVKAILAAAGLPEYLSIHDLRRTALTDGVEAGLSDRELMSLSGHSSPVSLRPYAQLRFEAALSGQEKRWKKWAREKKKKEAMGIYKEITRPMRMTKEVMDALRRNSMADGHDDDRAVGSEER